ncbi:MAG: hypothetical protein EHM28_04450 [Spirochaetaceae bacterium]|nr:MAG: hypothetical protein EHM28_04450 [Spirochaetaceae bacterium]
MTKKSDLAPQLLDAMEREHIDIDLALRVLNNYNSGKYNRVKPLVAASVPEIDGKSIIDFRDTIDFSIEKKTAADNLAKYGIDPLLLDQAPEKNGLIILSRKFLENIGLTLLHRTAFGVLNGGSASSYIDHKRNQSFDKGLFALYENEFHIMEKISRDRSKGITPAFLQPDMTPGPDYLELKLRSLCIQGLKAHRHAANAKPGNAGIAMVPFFQMTSLLTDQSVQAAIEKYRQSPLLSEFFQEGIFSADRIHTGVQPLLTAYSHSSKAKKKEIFSTAYGKQNSPLPMPGGHGQNFLALADIYRKLHHDGIRFAYLTNIDNMGATIDTAAIGLMAVTDAQAGFDFSFRTPIDIKGGILMRDNSGKINAADIGAAISFEEITQAEAEGKHILFNCATGLFNLDYLVKNLDYIIEKLPMRFSDQDKDAGLYSQAEQITWEMIGLVPRPLVFGVEKQRRFLAVKILLEGLLTSGLKLDDPAFPANESGTALRALGLQLHEGLKEKLQSDYGMKLENGRWAPKTIAEIRREQQ